MSKMKLVSFSMDDVLKDMAQHKASNNNESFSLYIRRLIRQDLQTTPFKCTKCGGEEHHPTITPDCTFMNVCNRCFPK